MGFLIQKLPSTLDSCGQHKLAEVIRRDFQPECLSAIGALVRELATLEHNYTHVEWLKKHLKDLTQAIVSTKLACQ
jgi:hypothetical protein